ncbi:hypothetical protein [Spirosoma sp. KNUC1025]|uniref:hypothetical protein n=1 Tax=Spirosoma sp. KNUC1025 TaxID=2894082 RepID=UPI001E446E4E|nr:hypothetical protein [Spirosoma sp. KNUC1025]UFH57773.1 hypothetical protein LN737_32645 [Spirosoma sp. KNUC1025]
MKYVPVWIFLLLVVLATACQREDKSLVIQNSLPNGGPYTHQTGVQFQKRIFWTRVMNETETPIEFTIHFPADSFPIPTSTGFYYKLFMPLDTMTLAKKSLADYGATGLHAFLDTSLYKPTWLQKTVNPKEEFLFYTALLMSGRGVVRTVDVLKDNLAVNKALAGIGAVRTGVVLKEKALFYKVSLGALDSTLIPCGHIRVKQ